MDDATGISMTKGNYKFVSVHAMIYHHNKHFPALSMKKIITTKYIKVCVPMFHKGNLNHEFQLDNLKYTEVKLISLPVFFLSNLKIILLIA